MSSLWLSGLHPEFTANCNGMQKQIGIGMQPRRQARLFRGHFGVGAFFKRQYPITFHLTFCVPCFCIDVRCHPPLLCVPQPSAGSKLQEFKALFLSGFFLGGFGTSHVLSAISRWPRIQNPLLWLSLLLSDPNTTHSWDKEALMTKTASLNGGRNPASSLDARITF